MDLPRTEKGNQQVVVFQELSPTGQWYFQYLTKSLSNWKTTRRRIIPVFGVPEALLSDSSAKFLSYLMFNLCKSLGIRKMNTTVYRLQRNGMEEWFNRTLKVMLQKLAVQHGNKIMVSIPTWTDLMAWTLPNDLMQQSGCDFDEDLIAFLMATHYKCTSLE